MVNNQAVKIKVRGGWIYSIGTVWVANRKFKYEIGTTFIGVVEELVLPFWMLPDDTPTPFSFAFLVPESLTTQTIEAEILRRINPSGGTRNAT